MGTTTIQQPTAAELRQWMDKHHRTVRGLAQELGTAPSRIQRYRDGAPIPPYITLALLTLERQEHATA